MKKQVGIFGSLVILVPLVFLALEYFRYLRHYTGASFVGKDEGWGW